jgi:hypothetical protein
MPCKFFVVPSHGAGQSGREVNAFLAARRIPAVGRRRADQGCASFWSFCVDYLPGAASPGFAAGRPGAPRGKADSRVVLKPEEFAVFARLRDRRKEVAAAEAVPLSTPFTNEQLSQFGGQVIKEPLA